MINSLKALIRHDAAGGVLLAASALVALLLANSPWLGMYQQLLKTPVVVSIGTFIIEKPSLLWINDGLMALFFLLVGLEIKRELIDGNLSSVQQVILPGIAAIGGIAVPALVFIALNYQDPVAVRGWAIPSATDIAFALGVFSIFGSRLPVTLKLFLLTVAIFDDIGAIIIIALFYSQDLSTGSLGVACVGLMALFALNRCGVRHIAPYMFVGILVWAAVLKSGVHATLAGFVIAWFIPLHRKNAYGKPMLSSLEHSLHPWITFFVLPVFAFANAGVTLLGSTLDQLFTPLTLGIALGLFVGKQLGIWGICWLAVKLGIASLPKGANWMQMYAVSLLCGIGFTMSLFIGSLAFEEAADAAATLAYQNNVKVGVLLGSLVSAIFGSGVLVYCSRQQAAQRGQ